MSWQVLTTGSTPAQLAMPFDAESIAFCTALGDALRHDPGCRDYPDLMGLAFWLRTAQIKQLAANYHDRQLKPLGQVVLFAPGNVDSFFVYSSLLSLLCGNINLIRLSQESGGSVEKLIVHLQGLRDAFPGPHARLQVVRCSHSAPQLLDYITQCDARVMWGSDTTIQTLRALPAPGHARDLCFSHKSSLAVLDAQALLNADSTAVDRLTDDFLRDTLTFAQQACTSPRTLVWLGKSSHAAAAQQQFWGAVSDRLPSKQWLEPSDAMSAFSTAQWFTMQPDSAVSGLALQPLPRLRIDHLNDWQHTHHSGCGLLLELTLNDLAALTPQLKPYHQTLSHWGIAEAPLRDWLTTNLIGLDRVVPVGQALQFTPVWDGVDLVHQLSRQVHCQTL